MTGEVVRFGLIGLDSPHAPSFTRLFNGDDERPPAVPGGRVVAAWPGEVSHDFALSRDRRSTFTDSVRSMGVPIESSIEAVAERCDALLVLAVDARRHPDYFLRCALFGRPVYVDTRFALSVSAARAMLAEAGRRGTLPLAGSPKRFSDEFVGAVAGERAEGVDLSGPMPMQPTQPGLFWYGIHMIDLMVGAMGTGCVEVRVLGSGADELVVASWYDGRTATFRGHRKWRPQTRGVVHGATHSTEFVVEASEPMFIGLLRALVDACRSGSPMIPPDEIEHVVAVTESINRSRNEQRAVRLDSMADGQVS